MKAKSLTTLLICVFILSCGKSKPCNCETDCTDQNVMVLTPENSVSSESIYASYLTATSDKINQSLNPTNTNQITEEQRQKLKDAIDRANVEVEALKPKIGGGICPPCPERICCNGKSYLILDPNFEKVKLPDLSNYKTLNHDGKVIVSLIGENSSMSSDVFTFSILGLDGNQVNIDFQIN
ncbi:MAG: hypothetical protein AAF901_02615 [Bacteroidota bacterium]